MSSRQRMRGALAPAASKSAALALDDRLPKSGGLCFDVGRLVEPGNEVCWQHLPHLFLSRTEASLLHAYRLACPASWGSSCYRKWQCSVPKLKLPLFEVGCRNQSFHVGLGILNLCPARESWKPSRIRSVDRSRASSCAVMSSLSCAVAMPLNSTHSTFSVWGNSMLMLSCDIDSLR